MLNPISEQSFDQLAEQGYNRIPLVVETFADLDTPLSLYLKLANKPYSYLLESVQGGVSRSAKVSTTSGMRLYPCLAS